MSWKVVSLFMALGLQEDGVRFLRRPKNEQTTSCEGPEMVVREKESGQHSCRVLYFPPRERESIPPGRSIFNHDVAGMWRALNVDIIGRLRPSDEHSPRRQQEIDFQHLHLAVRSNTSGTHVREWRGNVTNPGCCGCHRCRPLNLFPPSL